MPTWGQNKEISSWSFVIAGIFGAVGRMILVLLSALRDVGIYASLGEVVFTTLGMTVFLLGQMSGRLECASLRGPLGRETAPPERNE